MAEEDMMQHAGIWEGRRYAMPGKGTELDDYRYEQYADFTDDPAQRPGEAFEIQKATRFFDYEIRTLNIPGPLPRVQGLAPFARDPYGYNWSHLDEWGRLGKHDWTMRTQLFPKDYPFPIHRALIPMEITRFNFDPRTHLVQSTGPRAGLYTLSAARLRILRHGGAVVLNCMERFERASADLSLPLPTARDPDWHYGRSWLRLLDQSAVPAPPWKIAHLAQELRRRIMDGLGFVHLCIRFFLYFRLYRGRFAPPTFRTTKRFTGLMVVPSDERSRLIGEGLAELGVPVWTVHEANPNPPLELFPRGLTEDSLLWKNAKAQTEQRCPSWKYGPGYTREETKRQFQNDLARETHALRIRPIADIWVLRPGHGAEAPTPGPHFRSHPAHPRLPAGDEDELYIQRMARWLTSTKTWNDQTVLREMQESLGVGTVSLTPLPRANRFDPPMALFHETYPTCQRWAAALGGTWVEPPLFPQPRFALPLTQRISNPDNRSHGAPPALLVRLNEDPLYPSVPRSARVGPSTIDQNAPAPLVPRQVQAPPPRQTPSSQDEELPPFEEDDTDEASIAEPFLDFSQPEQIVEESPASPSPTPEPQSQDPDVDWDEECDRNHLYPVILAPFVYFGKEEELEEELYERYGTFVNAWFRGLQSLVLAYTNRERALLAIENQREAARYYLAEPSAGAIHPTAIPGVLVGFKAAHKAQFEQRVRTRGRLRLEAFPIPPRVMGISRHGLPAVIAERPPETRFEREALSELFTGSREILQHTRGMSYHLMSRYTVEPALLLRLLELRHGQEQATGATNTPLGTLIDLLRRHLSYSRPLSFSIPLLIHSSWREMMTSVAHDIPLVLPTSLMARGTYCDESFKWSGTREVYEIILDEIPMD
jgi:hypothetical protein